MEIWICALPLPIAARQSVQRRPGSRRMGWFSTLAMCIRRLLKHMNKVRTRPRSRPTIATVVASLSSLLEQLGRVGSRLWRRRGYRWRAKLLNTNFAEPSCAAPTLRRSGDGRGRVRIIGSSGTSTCGMAATATPKMLLCASVPNAKFLLGSVGKICGKVRPEIVSRGL